MRVQRKQVLKQNIFIKVLLIYNGVLVSAVQQNESVIHIYVSLTDIYIYMCVCVCVCACLCVCVCVCTHVCICICGFPGGSDGKESACSAGDSV